MNANVKAAGHEEWFDVVNERDEVIGQEQRAVVHAKELWHRAVYVLVFNEAGQLFMQKRALTKDSSPGMWTISCSGHVDAGEDYDAAAIRELGEELGWVPSSPPVRILRVAASEVTGWEFLWIYQLKAEGPFTLHPEEIDCGEWLELAELSRRLVACPNDFCSAFRWLWPRLAEKLI